MLAERLKHLPDCAIFFFSYYVSAPFIVPGSVNVLSGCLLHLICLRTLTSPSKPQPSNLDNVSYLFRIALRNPGYPIVSFDVTRNPDPCSNISRTHHFPVILTRNVLTRSFPPLFNLSPRFSVTFLSLSLPSSLSHCPFSYLSFPPSSQNLMLFVAYYYYYCVCVCRASRNADWPIIRSSRNQFQKE